LSNMDPCLRTNSFLQIPLRIEYIGRLGMLFFSNLPSDLNVCYCRS
jgi:hypothetical protein